MLVLECLVIGRSAAGSRCQPRPITQLGDRQRVSKSSTRTSTSTRTIRLRLGRFALFLDRHSPVVAEQRLSRLSVPNGTPLPGPNEIDLRTCEGSSWPNDYR